MASQLRPLKIKSSALTRLVKEVQYYEREYTQLENKLNVTTDPSDARFVQEQLNESKLARSDAFNRARQAQTELARMIKEIEPEIEFMGAEAIQIFSEARVAYANAGNIGLPVDGSFAPSNPESTAKSTADAATTTLTVAPNAESKEDDPMKERTFVAVKPDGVQRFLVGEIIQRFEKRGLKLVGLKLLRPSVELAQKHYAEHAERPFFPSLVEFLTSGPIVAMVWDGPNAVSAVRSMCGATNPIQAGSDTIRGQFGLTVSRNIVHSSDSAASGRREVGIWFKPEELVQWTHHLACQLYAL